MTEITVNCATPYRVLIKKGLLSSAAELIYGEAKADKYCIVTDQNVAPLYLSALKIELIKAGAEVYSFAFPAGEASKTLDTVNAILSLAAENHFTRSDCFIALGGGIVGDVCGFAASVYMRGVRFVQIPTTLLAMVDSSVGGKTGVNLNGLKNQIGAFWQPALVICDPDTLRTLPETEYRNGMAEVIKYAAICSPSLSEKLDGDICEVIAECVSIKSDIVSRDEHDNGERMLLNYGHTLGHAVEKVSEERIPHGMAVAIGMMAAARAAERLGIADLGTAAHTEELLATHGLPLDTELPREELLKAILNDKKKSGRNITLVLPKSFGKCVLHKVSAEELKNIY